MKLVASILADVQIPAVADLTIVNSPLFNVFVYTGSLYPTVKVGWLAGTEGPGWTGVSSGFVGCWVTPGTVGWTPVTGWVICSVLPSVTTSWVLFPPCSLPDSWVFPLVLHPARTKQNRNDKISKTCTSKLSF